MAKTFPADIALAHPSARGSCAALTGIKPERIAFAAAARARFPSRKRLPTAEKTSVRRRAVGYQAHEAKRLASRMRRASDVFASRRSPAADVIPSSQRPTYQ
jgi:hypothetical protein